MKKDIFKILEKNYIQKLFERKKEVFFPLIKNKISQIEIKKISPDWAQETCLVKYKILFDDKSQKIVRGTAKKNKSKQSVFKIMKFLYSEGFDRGHLRIAKPLYYDSDFNLLLYQEAPGITLTEFIEKNKKITTEDALKNAAQWLAKLHRLNPKQKKFPGAIFFGFSGYKKILKRLEKFSPEFKNYLPLNKIKFIDRLWDNNKTLIHNDFYPGNFIVDKKNFWGIDFDRAGLGPFLMDVASFYGSLKFPKTIWNLKLTKKQRDYFQNIFLNEYCRAANLDYFQIKKDLRRFLIKIFLDQIHYYSAFTIRGWNYMDKRTKKIFISKIKALLLEVKQHLRDI